MASENCVVQILKLFSRTKPGTRIDEFSETVEAWVLVLHPLDDDVVTQAAVTLSRQDGDFMPSTGAVFQGALDLMDNEPAADEAWNSVREYSRYANRIGMDNPVKLTDRTSKALDLIGGNCGNWLDKDIPFHRREFIEIYDSLEKQWRNEAALSLPAGNRRLLTNGD